MTDKSHLLRFGYAPGNYWFVCNDCGNKRAEGDKRSTRCEACAETLYSQVTSVEAVSDKHRGTPMTIPDEAVQAAWVAHDNMLGYSKLERHRAALTAALPFLTGAASPRAQALEEIISELKEAERKIFSWSGSAFVANELEGAEDADCKSELYGDLCKLGNVMYWLQTQVRALSSQPVADGWSPIETAPKDPNTVILVLLPSMMNLIVRARYNSVHGYWITDCDNDGRISKPTFFHPGDMWHPMPALPASPGASE